MVESHLGPTCDQREPSREHHWLRTDHGHDICVDCKITRKTSPIAPPAHRGEGGRLEPLDLNQVKSTIGIVFDEWPSSIDLEASVVIIDEAARRHRREVRPAQPSGLEPLPEEMPEEINVACKRSEAVSIDTLLIVAWREIRARFGSGGDARLREALRVIETQSVYEWSETREQLQAIIEAQREVARNALAANKRSPE